jgi:hypothetical protein
MNKAKVQMLSREACLKWISTDHPRLLVMAGAGDIDQLIYEAVDHYKNTRHA